MLPAFRVLGPLEVTVGGALAPLGPPKQRAVLAMLLLASGQAVTVRKLVDSLWSHDPPRFAVKNIQLYVYQLRKVVGRRLSSSAGGYLLDPGVDLDLARFRELVGQARQARGSGLAEPAVRLYREALAMWRGPALADLVGRDLLMSYADHLELLRLQAIDECIGLELDLHRHHELIAELGGLVARYPLNEVLWGHQIRALHAAGRRAEALAAYREAAAAIERELGVPPGPHLRNLARSLHHESV